MQKLTASTTKNPSVNKDFYKLWIGQSLSLIGNQISIVALPLLVVNVIGASTAKAALLPFALFLPFLLFGLPAGAIIDKLSRKKLMIVSDILQLIIYTLIFMLAILHLLPFALLMLLIFLSGILVVLFQISYYSYLPELFTKAKDLQKGNVKLVFSESMALIIGPMVAGVIILLIGISGTMAVNATTFLFSALLLIAIRTKTFKESTPLYKLKLAHITKDVAEGLKFVVKHPKLEPVVFCGAIYVLFKTMIQACLVLYLNQVFRLNATTIGLIVGAAAIGYPIGNMLSLKISNKLGISRTLALGASISVIGLFFIPVCGQLGYVYAIVIASVFHGIGEGIFNPTSLTLRQTEAPLSILSRVTSVQRFLIWGAIPLGSLLASIIIAKFNISIALWIGGIGSTLCLIPLLRRGILADVLNKKKVINNTTKFEV